jgi:hypothetical protein
MGKYTWLFFVAGAVLTWGAYVVTIDHGRSDLAGIKQAGKPLIPGPVAAMRAFLFIGLAYFFMGVVVPWIYLQMNKVDPAQYPRDPGYFKRGVTLSTVAGVLGAAGALCIVFAVGYARAAKVSPAAVASLVFCFAPIVNVIISMIIEPPATRPSGLFFLGILMAAAGAAMVLYFKPEPAPHHPAGGGGGGATAPTAHVTPASTPAAPPTSSARTFTPPPSRHMPTPPPVIDWDRTTLRLVEEMDAVWDRIIRAKFRDRHA